MLPSVAPLKRGDLSYEPRLAFDDVVGLEFRCSSRRAQREKQRRWQGIRSLGCGALEPGDTVLIDRHPPPRSNRVALDTGVVQHKKHRHTRAADLGYGRILMANPSLNTVVVKRDVGDGSAVVERFDTSSCIRQRDVFSVWSGPDTPLLTASGRDLVGITPSSSVFQKKREGWFARSQWSNEALKRYRDTNLSMVASGMSACAVGATGVIYRKRLEDFFVGVDAIPDNAVARKEQMDRVMYVFGFSPKPQQLQELLAASIPGDSVEVAHFVDIMAYFHNVVNGAGASVFARTCFELYCHDSRGYVHVDKLREWRRWRCQEHAVQRDRGCNATQVKVLLDIFAKYHRYEESTFVTTGKKSKGAKKPSSASPAGRVPAVNLSMLDNVPTLPPGSAPVLPRHYALRRHINLEEFSTHLQQDPQMVLAFLPVALVMLKEESALGGLNSFVPQVRTKAPERLTRTFSEFFITSSDRMDLP